MRILFFGTPDFVIPVLEPLLTQYDVVGVITAPDTFQGRKKVLTPSPAKRFAVDKGISPVLTPQKFNNLPAGEAGETIEQLQSLAPDLFVVAAYGKIIPTAILDIPKYGAINIHPSLLPKYRGPSPIQTALLNGDPVSGVTIIKMDEKMDHGPILIQKEIPLKSDDTFEKLQHTMFREAAQLLPGVIDAFVSGEITPVSQNEEQATYCHIITKQDGYVDSQNPPDSTKLDRMIRAYYPWPTAWTRVEVKNQKERIMRLLPEEKIQIEGGKPMTVKELLNGYSELKETIKRLGLITDN